MKNFNCKIVLRTNNKIMTVITLIRDQSTYRFIYSVEVTFYWQNGSAAEEPSQMSVYSISRTFSRQPSRVLVNGISPTPSLHSIAPDELSAILFRTMHIIYYILNTTWWWENGVTAMFTFLQFILPALMQHDRKT